MTIEITINGNAVHIIDEKTAEIALLQAAMYIGEKLKLEKRRQELIKSLYPNKQG